MKVDEIYLVFRRPLTKVTRTYNPSSIDVGARHVPALNISFIAFIKKKLGSLSKNYRDMLKRTLGTVKIKILGVAT